MKTVSDALNVVSHPYPETSRKTPSGDDDSQPWNNLDPARLIDLLDDIDGLKQEVHERMARIDAVNKAKSLLQEDAIRTEALNRRLAELGKAFVEVRPQKLTPEPRTREAELLRMPVREPHLEYPHLQLEVAFRPVDEVAPASICDVEAAFAEDSIPQAVPTQLFPLQSEPENPQWAAIENHAGHQVARDDTFPAATDLGLAIDDDAASPEKTWVQITDSYRSTAQRFSETAVQKHEVIQVAGEAKLAFEAATQKLEQAEAAWNRANASLAEAKQLFAQSTEQVSLARSKTEAAATDLKSAQQDLTTSYQFASVAAQRQNDAAQFFHRSNRWTIHAAATSWIALSWFAWFVYRTQLPIWAPAAASGLLVLLALLIAKWVSRAE